MLPAGVGAATPFASNQADLGSNVAPSSANSMRVMAIVLGLGFIVSAIVVAAVAVLLVGFFGLGAAQGTSVAGGAKGKEHVRDTGLVEEVDLQAIRGPRGPGAAPVEPGEVDPMAEMFGGLGAAPVTVYTQGKGKEMYRQIEILCHQVDFRKRATLVNDKAHIPIVPAARCQLVFQGNVPMKSWITGGDTVRCTFQPIDCRKIN